MKRLRLWFNEWWVRFRYRSKLQPFRVTSGQGIDALIAVRVFWDPAWSEWILTHRSMNKIETVRDRLVSLAKQLNSTVRIFTCRDCGWKVKDLSGPCPGCGGSHYGEDY